jgi:hypothetical protein
MKQNTFIIILTLWSSIIFGQKSKNYLISFTDSSSGKELIGYKTVEGKIVIPAKYQYSNTDTMYNMAIVLKEFTWVGINRNDSVILIPFIYDNGPDYIEEGLFRFVENGKIGFANLNGEKVIPAIFDFVDFFRNGIAEYTLGGQRIVDGEHWSWGGGYETGYINKQGQLFIKVTDLNGNYREAWTKQMKKHVRLNKQGQIVKVYSGEIEMGCLNLTDFRKSYNYHRPNEHNWILDKGFFLTADTILDLRKKFIFCKLNKEEIIVQEFLEDGEGGEFLKIKYLLKNEKSYKKFIDKLAVNKFKYSKRNKRYQLPTSSYSGENVYLNGVTEYNGEIYYELEYHSYVEKALGLGRRNYISEPLKIDTIKK